MTGRKVRGKDSGRVEKSSAESGAGNRKSLMYGRGGPGGAQEGRADTNITEGEVLNQSQRSGAIAKGPGLPEKPIGVGAEPYNLEKTPGVPGGMSGMENEGNTGVHRGGSEYPAISEDTKEIIGAKKGASRKKRK